jgi:hypothetical protein
MTMKKNNQTDVILRQLAGLLLDVAEQEHGKVLPDPRATPPAKNPPDRHKRRNCPPGS